VIHGSMPYDPIQHQGHGGLKCAKCSVSKSVFSSMYTMKILMVNYDTQRQYMIFNWTDF